jgi:hypothetical protein
LILCFCFNASPGMGSLFLPYQARVETRGYVHTWQGYVY